MRGSLLIDKTVLEPQRLPEFSAHKLLIEDVRPDTKKSFKATKRLRHSVKMPEFPLPPCVEEGRRGGAEFGVNKEQRSA